MRAIVAEHPDKLVWQPGPAAAPAAAAVVSTWPVGDDAALLVNRVQAHGRQPQAVAGGQPARGHWLQKVRRVRGAQGLTLLSRPPGRHGAGITRAIAPCNP